MSLIETFANPGVSKAGQEVLKLFGDDNGQPGEPLEAAYARELVKSRGMGEFEIMDAVPWVLGGIVAAVLVKNFGK